MTLDRNLPCRSITGDPSGGTQCILFPVPVLFMPGKQASRFTLRFEPNSAYPLEKQLRAFLQPCLQVCRSRTLLLEESSQLTYLVQSTCHRWTLLRSNLHLVHLGDSCASAVATQQRSTSATLQAWAIHPRGVYGSSASKISLIEPMPA